MKEEESQDRESLLKELAISDEYLPDEGAPPPDHALLVALARQELSEERAYEVSRLIAGFRSWSDAFNEVLDGEHTTWLSSQPSGEPRAGSLEASARSSTSEGIRSSGDVISSKTDEHQLRLHSVSDQASGTRASSTSSETSPVRPIWRRYPLTMLGLAAAVMAAIGIVVWSNNGREPKIVAQLKDAGGLVTLDKNGRFSGLDSVPADLRDETKGVLLAQRLPTPFELTALRGTRSTPDDGALEALISPVRTVVESDRPTFRWKTLPGAENYTVLVYDSESEVVAKSPPIIESAWTAEEPLKRGAVYSWEVVTRKDGKELVAPPPNGPAAKFRILDEDKLEQFRQLRQSVGPSHLVMGVIYTQAGLMDDAETELKQLVAANPESDVARKLLDSARKMRFTSP